MTYRRHPHPLDDDMMRSWYVKYLFNDNSLRKLTARMQEELVMQFKLAGISSDAGGTRVGLLSFLGEIIFKASVAALFNSKIANTKDLYEAFCSADQALPLAAAGVPMDYFAYVMINSSSARTELHRH